MLIAAILLGVETSLSLNGWKSYDLLSNVEPDCPETPYGETLGIQLHITEFSTLQNNPQHPRVLVNDWLGTRLAEMIGLPVPVPAIVDVHPWLVEHSPELRIEVCGHKAMITPGLSFGSRYVVSPQEGQVYDYLPEEMLGRVRNINSFAGVLALDKWTCNADGRQVAFWRRPRERKFNASFIDQGYFFNAGEWSFPDAPLRGVFGRNDVYAGITGWDSFEPWLSRIESFPESSLWPLVDQIPPEWYGSAVDELDRLLAQLLERRARVRELILSFKNSCRSPFPNWRSVSSVAAATQLCSRRQR